MKRRKTSRNGAVKIVITINVHGGGDDGEIRRAAYEGMLQAVRECDAALPDRIAGINTDGSWR